MNNPDLFIIVGPEVWGVKPNEPYIYDSIPADEFIDVDVFLNELQFNITDFQGDSMNYLVVTSPDIGSGGANDVGNGTYAVSVSGLEYDTVYTWFVKLQKNHSVDRERDMFVPDPPSGFSAVSVNRSCIALSWVLAPLYGV